MPAARCASTGPTLFHKHLVLQHRQKHHRHKLVFLFPKVTARKRTVTIRDVLQIIARTLENKPEQIWKMQREIQTPNADSLWVESTGMPQLQEPGESLWTVSHAWWETSTQHSAHKAKIWEQFPKSTEGPLAWWTSLKVTYQYVFLINTATSQLYWGTHQKANQWARKGCGMGKMREMSYFGEKKKTTLMTWSNFLAKAVSSIKMLLQAESSHVHD